MPGLKVDSPTFARLAVEATNLFYFMKIASTNKLEDCDSAGEASTGVCIEEASAADKRTTCLMWGYSPVVIGAAVSVMAVLTVDSSGRAVTATDTDWVVGIALEAGSAAGDQIQAMVFPGGFAEI
jgi:hypothetical protein